MSVLLDARSVLTIAWSNSEVLSVLNSSDPTDRSSRSRICS